MAEPHNETPDRLAEIKDAWDIQDHGHHNKDVEDETRDLLLESVPWLIAEVERLRIAASIVQKLAVEDKPDIHDELDGGTWWFTGEDGGDRFVRLTDAEVDYLAAAAFSNGETPDVSM